MLRRTPRHRTVGKLIEHYTQTPIATCFDRNRLPVEIVALHIITEVRQDKKNIEFMFQTYKQ